MRRFITTVLSALAIISSTIPYATAVLAAPPGAPAAPSALTAAVVSATRVDLAWQDNSTNETGFRIERSGGGSGGFVNTANVSPDIQNFSDAAVTANNSYVYRVIAFNLGGDSDASNEATAAVRPPDAPSALTATVINASRVDLAWTNPVGANITNIRLERSTNDFAAIEQLRLARQRGHLQRYDGQQ